MNNNTSEMPPSQRTTILVVDDEEAIRQLCYDLLTTVEYNVLTAPDGADAIRQLAENAAIDLVITDLKMPGVSGLDILAEIESSYPHLGVIVLTGYASLDNTVQAMRLGAINLVRKPFNLQELLDAVSHCIEKNSSRQQVAPVADGQIKDALASRIAQLDELHSEFLSVTSHELLTPLTPVAGYVESLIQGDLGPMKEDQKEALELVNSEIAKLKSTITSLLRIKELESDNHVIEPALVDLESLVNEELQLAKSGAVDKSLTLSVRFSGNLQLYTDPLLLQSIIHELIANSLRFASEGGFILIKCIVTDEGLTLSVEDNGIGIDEASLAHVFDRFYRVARGTKRQYSGLGIGLTLVKGLVESLGGTVNIVSVFGEGTVVTVNLPALAGRD